MSTLLKFPFVFLLCLSFSYLPSIAQRVEVGGSIGAANYVGDLAPSMTMKETHPAVSVFGRYNISSSFAFTGTILVSRLSGSDANFDVNRARNLSFRSNLTEFSGVFEFNYFKYGLDILDKHFTSYVFLGLGVFRYNPQGFILNEWVDLRPLQTEGESYGNTSVCVPFGLGIKWRLSKHLSLESSLGFRKTFTDRLDDVSGFYADINSQLTNKGTLAARLTDRSAEVNNGTSLFSGGYKRGNRDFNDWYMVGNVTLSVRIFGRYKCGRFY